MQNRLQSNNSMNRNRHRSNHNNHGNQQYNTTQSSQSLLNHYSHHPSYHQNSELSQIMNNRSNFNQTQLKSQINLNLNSQIPHHQNLSYRQQSQLPIPQNTDLEQLYYRICIFPSFCE